MSEEQNNTNQDKEVFIDVPRLKKALESESFELPKNLNRKEMIEFICSKAKNEK